MSNDSFSEIELHHLRQINSIATRFELELNKGSSPAIEDVLTEVPVSLRPHLLRELLECELERLSVVDVAVVARYAGRFASFPDVVADVLAARTQSAKDGPLDETVGITHGDGHNDDQPHPDDSGVSGPDTTPPGLSFQPKNNHRVCETLGRQHGFASRVTLDGSAPNQEVTGRYQLDGEIARGGMGAVLRGQDTDLGRDLAIKVLLDEHKDDLDVVRRFVDEARIGGQLQHPGIAPVYELGQFADDRPFFTMKLVRGETLAALLQERTEGSEDRNRFVGIFVTICQTMAYAHSRNVIHRDLKPANIMVGAFGEVQVMDWGLAKVLGEPDATQEAVDEDPERTLVPGLSDQATDSAGSETQMGSVLGTLAYMAPEQALGDVDLLDRRTDVFGLGAILCTLLTGKPPYIADSGKQVHRMATRTDTGACFDRLDNCGADLQLIALAKECLADHRERRPEDASVVAERMTAYLASVESKLREAEIQRAEEAARVIEERKRRRVSLALAASVLLLLSVAGGGWLYMERQETNRQTAFAAEQTRSANAMEKLAQDRDEQRLAAIAASKETDARRQEADDNRETAEEVAAFMSGLFQDVDPIARTGRSFGAQSRVDGKELTALEVVRRGNKKLKTSLLGKPRVRAALLDQIGNVYLSLDQVEEAAPLLEEALQIRMREYGDESLPAAASIQSIGLLEMSRGTPVEATASFDRALRIRRKHLEPNDLLIAETLFHVGIQQSLSMQLVEAEKSLSECLAIRRAASDGPSFEVVAALLTLAQLHVTQRDYGRVMPLMQEAASMTDELNGNNDFSAIVSLFTRAELLGRIGTTKAARATYEQMDQKAARLLGENHQVLAFARARYSEFLIKIKDHEAAIVKLQQVIAVYRRAYGSDFEYLARMLVSLGRERRIMGDIASAEANFLEGLRIFELPGEKQHGYAENHAAALHLLGALNDDRGDRETAREMLHEAMVILFRNYEEEHWRMRDLAHDYSCILLNWPENKDTVNFRKHRKPVGRPAIDVELAEQWSLAAEATRKERYSSQNADERVTRYLQTKSVQCLRSAFENGYHDAAAIRANKSFGLLEGNEEFQQLMADMANIQKAQR